MKGAETMRIGRVMIDTDNMSVEELDMLIEELTHIKVRKERAESLRKQMNRLIEKAKNEGFTFIDKDYGFVREVDDSIVFDEKA